MAGSKRVLLALLSLLLAHQFAARAQACDRCRPQAPTAAAPQIDTAALLRNLDQRAAASASARPHLSFPARIGVARIAEGVVTPIPADEWAAWRALRDRVGPIFGDFSPVSALVAQSLTAAPLSATPHDAITHLRLAAAREQLDAILLYDVSTTHSLEQTELSLLDATIVGAWWFPVHKSHLAAQASATLIDVRSGLAYGSALGHATDVCSAALLGSEEKRARQRATTVRKAVEELASEVGAMATRLASSPARHYTSSSGSAPPPSPAPLVASERVEPQPDEDRLIPPPTGGGGESFWGTR